MKIEEITTDSIRNVNDAELKNLRFRFIQLWGAHFKDATGDEYDDFLRRYKILVNEMTRRGLERKTLSELDHRIVKQSIFGLDPKALPERVCVPDYISIVGSYVKSPKTAADVDLVIRDNPRDEGLEIILQQAVASRLSKPIHLIYNPQGPHADYLPLYDLVLRPKPALEVVEVPQEAGDGGPFDAEYYSGLEDWDERLAADNRAVMEALEPGSVLDLGCGTGKLLAQLQAQGRSVAGIDSNQFAVRACLARGVPAIQFDLNTFPYPLVDQAFDNVIFVHSLEHLDDPARAVYEAKRIARKRVVILVPLGESKDPTHKHRFEADELKDREEFKGAEIKVLPPDLAGRQTALITMSFTSKEVRLEPYGKFRPPKPSMYGLTDAFSVDEIVEWAKKRFPLYAEEKLNGFRAVAEKVIGQPVRIKTEGGVDRTEEWAEVSEVLNKVPASFILDMSVGIVRNGLPLPRIKLMTLMADEPKLEEHDLIQCSLFDLPYWDGDIHQLPYEKRRKKLEEFFDRFLKEDPRFRLTNSVKVASEEELREAFRKLGRLPQSEGLVVKTRDGAWEPTGSTSEWVKLKNEVELKVIVLERHQNKAGGWNYTCGLLLGDTDFENTRDFKGETYVDLGRTYNTTLKAEVGDILTVGVEEVIPDEEEKRLAWLGPRVIDIDPDRSEPYFASQAIDMAKRANVLQKAEGNITYEEGDSGVGVMQLHIMGLDEQEAKALEEAEKRLLVARTDIEKLRRLLLELIGNHACHLDIRLVRDDEDYFEGGEIMVGNIDSLTKLASLDAGNHLRFGWKVPHAEEPDVETIRGPAKWMDVGSRSLAVFAPGTVGAFSKSYAAMLRLDRFNWELYYSKEHAKKFHVEHGRFLDGNYLVSFVPVEEGRVWMVSRLKDEDHLEEEVEMGLEVEKAHGFFGSPGGKSRVAKFIVDYIPEHTTYVEPFAGGAAVLFSKQPSEREALFDLDPEIAFAYRYVKTLTDEKLANLKKMDWASKKSKFLELRDSSAKGLSDDQRFFRFIYLTKYSWGSQRRTYGYHPADKKFDPDILPRYKERLAKVEIYNQDYREALKRFDSKNTFFFVDPPYPEEWSGFGTWTMDDIKEMAERLKKADGKWIVTLPNKNEYREIFKGCHFKVFRIRRTLSGEEGEDTELMIANFPLVKRREYSLEKEEALEKALMPFGGPGGKKLLSPTIVKYIPKHKRYVEPFAGGAAVFYKKTPSEEEILADIDPDIAFAHKFIQSFTEEKQAALDKKEWVVSKKKYEELEKSSPKDDIDRFYRFIYLLRGSYGFARKGVAPAFLGKNIRPDYNRWWKAKDRLKNAKIYCADYRQIVKRFDGPDTFFYFDPPYPENWGGLFGEKFETEQLIEICKKLKGHFILSLFDTPENRKLCKSFYIKRVMVPRTLQSTPDSNFKNQTSELLVSDLPFKVRNVYVEKEAEEFEVEKLMRPVASPGGKWRLAETIISLIPPHKVYVEPFAGGASVLMKKEPSEVEVLNDIDPEVIFAYRYVQKFDVDKVQRLKRFNWVSSRERWQRLLNSKEAAANDDERFYRYHYTMRASYAYNRKTYWPDKEGVDMSPDYDGLFTVRERTKNVKLSCKDYKKAIEEWDGKDTFFYLDPPYPGRWSGPKETGDIELDELVKALKQIKGKFILSLPDTAENRKAFKDYFKRSVDVRRTYHPDSPPDRELLIANFPLKRQDEYSVAKSMRIWIDKEEERLVTGIVYEPNVVDAQGDWADEETIREAAFNYMMNRQKVKIKHRGEVNPNLKIVESYIAPVDMRIGGQPVRKGSWIITVKVLDDNVWEDVKSGRLQGFSLAGTAEQATAAKYDPDQPRDEYGRWTSTGAATRAPEQEGEDTAWHNEGMTYGTFCHKELYNNPQEAKRVFNEATSRGLNVAYVTQSEGSLDPAAAIEDAGSFRREELAKAAAQLEYVLDSPACGVTVKNVKFYSYQTSVGTFNHGGMTFEIGGQFIPSSGTIEAKIGNFNFPVVAHEVGHAEFQLFANEAVKIWEEKVKQLESTDEISRHFSTEWNEMLDENTMSVIQKIKNPRGPKEKFYNAFADVMLAPKRDGYATDYAEKFTKFDTWPEAIADHAVRTPDGKRIRYTIRALCSMNENFAELASGIGGRKVRNREAIKIYQRVRAAYRALKGRK